MDGKHTRVWAVRFIYDCYDVGLAFRTCTGACLFIIRVCKRVWGRKRATLYLTAPKDLFCQQELGNVIRKLVFAPMRHGLTRCHSLWWVAMEFHLGFTQHSLMDHCDLGHSCKSARQQQTGGLVLISSALCFHSKQFDSFKVNQAIWFIWFTAQSDDPEILFRLELGSPLSSSSSQFHGY